MRLRRLSVVGSWDSCRAHPLSIYTASARQHVHISKKLLIEHLVGIACVNHLRMANHSSNVLNSFSIDSGNRPIYLIHAWSYASILIALMDGFRVCCKIQPPILGILGSSALLSLFILGLYTRIIIFKGSFTGHLPARVV